MLVSNKYFDQVWNEIKPATIKFQFIVRMQMQNNNNNKNNNNKWSKTSMTNFWIGKLASRQVEETLLERLNEILNEITYPFRRFAINIMM